MRAIRNLESARERQLREEREAKEKEALERRAAKLHWQADVGAAAQAKAAVWQLPTWTFEEWSLVTDLSENKYYDLKKDGLAPPSFRVGDRVFFRRDEVFAWLLSQPDKPQPTVSAPESDDLESEVNGRDNTPDMRYLHAASSSSSTEDA